jgi:ATP-dependent helicase/nuclease subunit B
MGPAGSGKTFRCLADVRAELKREPAGLPLLFIAPKQATFQIERELLADPELHGYTRLQVLSFERLARFVLDQFAVAPPRVLTEEGRVMVLRALLAEHERDLKIFHGSTRLAGFAHQLSSVLRELQRHHVSAEQLLDTAKKLADVPQLADKLRDLALMLQSYLAWLRRNGLHDANSLFDLATDAVNSAVRNKDFQCEALWLDGFAELSSQELALLLAVLQGCKRAKLAFCTELASSEDWLSPWIIAAQTASRCVDAVRSLPRAQVTIEQLERNSCTSRFSDCVVLAHLERFWAQPQAWTGERVEAIRLKACLNPEAEAAAAAHEILEHVHRGGRFREVGILLRNFDGHHDAIRRVFKRYEIPFFIDRREPVAHHPLPELTRSVLRLAAYDWPMDDWFAILKTGLVPAEDFEIDALENEALERGWCGNLWRKLFSGEGTEGFEALRRRLVPPFEKFVERVNSAPLATGTVIASAFEELWNELQISATLERWTKEAGPAGKSNAIHSTLWEQLSDWLDDVATAFANQGRSLHDWVRIVESGLSDLSVGAVPPAVDQVMVGTIDRSRNPNLQLAIVLGLNEGTFPAPPPLPLLLTDSERGALETTDLVFGPASRCLLGHERYFGYIACTRSRQRLVLTWSAVDWRETKLNRSCFIDHVLRLFPQLQIEEWHTPARWSGARHLADLTPELVGLEEAATDSSPKIERLRQTLRSLSSPSINERLSSETAGQLYGERLRTSITSLERFGQCPFRFFVHSGLRAQERKLFEIDPRKAGDFQHQVLKAFHDELKRQGKRWRDISPAEARRRIETLAGQRAEEFGHGLFRAAPRERFVVRQLTRALQDVVEVLVDWMHQYRFDPGFVELRFAEGGDIPPCQLQLSAGHTLVLTGSIDRVDLFKQPDGTALCVVIDFKTGTKKIDQLLLDNGIQIQLPAYLNVLRHLPDPSALFGVRTLIPAGIFYVPLRAKQESVAHRDEALRGRDEAHRLAYQHRGRFDRTLLPFFDSRRPAAGASFSGDQFFYQITPAGKLDGRRREPMNPQPFHALLEAVDAQIRNFGVRILEGDTAVAPYRHGAKTPCDYCDYAPICRIDPWTHHYRRLETMPEA